MLEGMTSVSGQLPLAETATAGFLRAAERSLPAAYRLAGCILGDAGEAEDATQDALLRAWLHRSDLRDPDRFAAWFDRIVVNVCRDRVRSRHGVHALSFDDRLGPLARPEDPFRALFARDEVGRAARRLDADHLAVVALRFWRDLSLEEIAERLDVPLGTVKSRLHYALRAMREELARGSGEVAR